MSTPLTSTLVPELLSEFSAEFSTGDTVKIRGNRMANRLSGSAQADLIKGKGGNDKLRGLAGDDAMMGGKGNDRMFGGTGNDAMMGGKGNDRMFGGTGNDAMMGGKGNDRMFGGAGNDAMVGGFGNDRMFGGTGNDAMVGSFGRDRMFGGMGNDELVGDVAIQAKDFNKKGYFKKSTARKHGNDVLRGGDGNDWLQDQLGSDRMFGGTGDDTLVSVADSGTPAENKAIGANVDDGNDVDKLNFSDRFVNPAGLAANDRLTGGAGADTFKFDLLINAPRSIWQQHQNDDGSIEWGMNGVAGENDNYHDHWVDGIGRDTITDFSGTGGEGDDIVITGHTVTYKVLKEMDNRVVLGIYSDQGADGVRGGGAHDMDVLGVVRVNHDGNFNINRDVKVVNNDLGSF